MGKIEFKQGKFYSICGIKYLLKDINYDKNYITNYLFQPIDIYQQLPYFISQNTLETLIEKKSIKEIEVQK